MCGRFFLMSPREMVAEHFQAIIDPFDDPGPRLDIRPTQQIQVVLGVAAERRLTIMRWGFLPHWYRTPNAGPLIINARSETVAGKPAFRQAIRETRCLIPANGFFEWKPGPEPGPERVHRLAPERDALVAFAGVWRHWQGEEGHEANTVAIVTCPANTALAAIHHRLPVVIAPPDYGLWLGEKGKGAAVLMKAPVEGFFQVEKGRGPGEPVR